VNYADFKASGTGLSSLGVHGFFPGGQFFGELNYKYENWFFGFNVEYQVTVSDYVQVLSYSTNVTADNMRIGARVGFTF
jgi:hypothetical protein